jgi:uncharacterized protein YcfL
MSTVRSFIDAIGYVERNQKSWGEMIAACWNEWTQENLEIDYKFYFYDTEKFKNEMLQKYGIVCFVSTETQLWDYHIIDHKKYVFFQIKYAR